MGMSIATARLHVKKWMTVVAEEYWQMAFKKNHILDFQSCFVCKIREHLVPRICIHENFARMNLKRSKCSMIFVALCSFWCFPWI